MIFTAGKSTCTGPEAGPAENARRMFSIPDVGVISVLALLLFGPDRLPGMMRQAGKIMREVQNTSQSFIAEMERAADIAEHPTPPSAEPVDAPFAAGEPAELDEAPEESPETPEPPESPPPQEEREA